MSREEDIDHTLGLVLERSLLILLDQERVCQLVRNLIPDATDEETARELVLLVGNGWVEVVETPLGSKRYRLSAAGILARRRGDL